MIGHVFHAIRWTQKLFIGAYVHGTLLITMLKALHPYLQRNVIKDPKPATLELAIKRTCRVFHTAQPPVPQPQVVHAVATSTPRQLPGPYMCLHQRPNQWTWTQCARLVRTRAPSPSEPLTSVSEALELPTRTKMPFQVGL